MKVRAIIEVPGPVYLLKEMPGSPAELNPNKLYLVTSSKGLWAGQKRIGQLVGAPGDIEVTAHTRWDGGDGHWALRPPQPGDVIKTTLNCELEL